MKRSYIVAVTSLVLSVTASAARGQEYSPADRGQPGDAMIQQYLDQATEAIHARFLENVASAEDWRRLRSGYEEEYFYMLGLSPRPPKTPLAATVTGTLEGAGYVVEMIHYQSRPGLYVTGNLYRPSKIEASTRLPAVLYVSGHAGQGRNGNKTSFQSHGIWFARHGYVCLLLDTLQLGEIAAVHHGTYRQGRWWWHSRGYTPAGVECWNGIRGIDYLLSRADVDAERIAVTGISGGGAATFWIAAADPRVKVAVPVSGMADLPSYVSHRVINGHCDCMFLYNTFQWPWTRIAALVAPRPLLFVNSNQDRIFPMDANQRVINRLERLYGLFGKGNLVDSVVSVGGHAYREDIREAAYRFINTHLKDDPKAVTDGEVDLITGKRPAEEFPIAPERLRVFPTDADIPADQLNTTIDEHFVAQADTSLPEHGRFDAWKADLLGKLRAVTLRSLPERIPPARPTGSNDDAAFQTEEGIRLPAECLRVVQQVAQPRRLLLVVDTSGSGQTPEWIADIRQADDDLFVFSPRGTGPTCWTKNNPPNFVERSHVLLGRTVDTGRIRDIIAIARYLPRETASEQARLVVAGEGAAGVLAAYAAALEAEIEGAILHNPILSHMETGAPQLLNVLRVCDVPDVLGMIAPKRLAVDGCDASRLAKTAAIYASADAAEHFTLNGKQ